MSTNENDLVVDFFAGSGTVGRACIEEGRHCLMCDSDPASLDFFKLHLEHMEDLWLSSNYRKVESIEEFFKEE